MINRNIVCVTADLLLTFLFALQTSLPLCMNCHWIDTGMLDCLEHEIHERSHAAWQACTRRGGARKKIAWCITAICMFKWEVCMPFGQYLGVK
jgi:hypothetical protein